MLGEQSTRFSTIVAAESSKTINEAEREVRRCIETLRLSAGASEELAGATLGFEDSLAAGTKVGWYSRKPVGIVAAITPFNDPLNLVAHKLGPALIGGNGVVLKPSGRTPLSGLALVELLLEAGVPSGRIAAIVSGPGVSEALVTDERVDLISFTGGPATADRIAAAAGAKKILSELGGNNATQLSAPMPTRWLPRLRLSPVPSAWRGRTASPYRGSTSTRRCLSRSWSRSRPGPRL